MQRRAPRRDELRDRTLQGLADPLDVAQEPLLHQHRRLFREVLDHSRSRCIRLDLERILSFQLQEKGDLLKNGCDVTLGHGLSVYHAKREKGTGYFSLIRPVREGQLLGCPLRKKSSLSPFPAPFSCRCATHFDPASIIVMRRARLLLTGLVLLGIGVTVSADAQPLGRDTQTSSSCQIGTSRRGPAVSSATSPSRQAARSRSTQPRKPTGQISKNPADSPADSTTN